MASIKDMNSEEWESMKRTYAERLRTIVIPIDTNAAIAKGLLSRIDGFFSEVRLQLAETEGQKERIDSIIREWEREKATGSNEMARKREATLALQNFELPGGAIQNLYDVQRDLTERVIYLQGISDVLYGKQSRLITITGVLKLEKDLLPYADMS